jgi:hypothetical protein
MRQLFSERDLRALGRVLALAILIASLPFGAGVVVVSGPSQPEITLDICHPIQASEAASNAWFARPATLKPEFLLRELGPLAITEPARLAEYKAAPDTPPPKQLV